MKKYLLLITLFTMNNLFGTQFEMEQHSIFMKTARESGYKDLLEWAENLEKQEDPSGVFSHSVQTFKKLHKLSLNYTKAHELLEERLKNRKERRASGKPRRRIKRENK